MTTPSTQTPSTCPCGSGKAFAQCCDLYLSGKTYPNNAESLMRSRYSAYVTGNLPYLKKSWHPDTYPGLSEQDLHTKWLRLEVVKAKKGLKKSVVEFKAWFEDDDAEHALHEISLFKLYKKRWVYVEPLESWD
ncbi:SEC-C domain-containing protein [Microbulbifer agarilyticus]|uniref:YchJ family protein n=1 Tax=Microbulbifer agarilyticus TaxID=260552 RepID=UPI001C9414A6|nr:YchJ family metal-binding protein [Microbulbifer agarilyticus]MBY6189544.1 SEC-C domain-containing protein [Microbulbifer agarilyticus]